MAKSSLVIYNTSYVWATISIATDYGLDGPGFDSVCSELLTGKAVRGVNTLRVESERQCSE
jgi:hypothetical protein